MSPLTRRTTIIAAVLALLSVDANARITRIVIERRESPALDGRAFAVGRYERLIGRAYGELDPADPLNAIITDIELAQRNKTGLVEYSATFTLSIPADLSKTNGILLYEVPNRGNIPREQDVSISVPHNRGYMILTSGWQGDLAPAENRETITVPIARKPDGSSITGPVLVRWVGFGVDRNTLALNESIGPHAYHRPASMDTSKAKLTKRASEASPAVAVASSNWAFGDCRSAAFPGKPDPSRICVKGTLDSEALYELSFTAKDPLVLGIGFAATRDLVSYFRHADKDDTGAVNPVAGRIHHALSTGSSQSGNFLRTFLHLGFNQDESGGIVFDGMNPQIAMRLLAMNIRFAIPGATANMYEAGSDGTLWWSEYNDTVRHRGPSSLLSRCRETSTCPKIIETLGSNEFWFLRASPNFVGTDAQRDIPLPPEVRRYYFPATAHGGGSGVISATRPKPPGACTLPTNTNPERPSTRALLVALTDWVVKGTPPPPSRYPRLDRGELVQPNREALGFPSIPGMPIPDGLLNPVYDYDFGQAFRYSDVSGVITNQPPAIRQVIPMLVPKVNADGNEMLGVPSVQLQVPLGTYLGWNVTASGYAKGRICSLAGGFIPFAKTKAERLASGDPRPSLEERYSGHQDYVARVKAAADKAVRERFLLREDADRLVQAAASSDVLQ